MLHKVIPVAGKEPNEWRVVTFANPGSGSEEMVTFFFSELPEIVDATLIFDPRRTELKDAIGTILIEGLLPAFEHLKKIRASVDADIPLLNRNQHFEDFWGRLWPTYAHLFQEATKPTGYDMGFLFQNDNNFERGLMAFQSQHPNVPSTLGNYLRKQRNEWQCELAMFRNDYLVHRKPVIPDFEKMYRPETAEALFQRVWMVIADVLVCFLSLNLPSSTLLQLIPPQERNPLHPRYFRFVPAPGVRFVRP